MKDPESNVDLLLTDVVMPGKNGAELLSQAKLNHPNLHVLFMSGYTGDVVALRGLLTQEHFLEKPFTRKSLLSKVHSALHSDPQTT
jgi:YesN/AraC family two-component response regulator